MNLQDAMVVRGCAKMALVDSFQNIYFLWKVWLTLFVVDQVLAPEDGPEGFVADVGQKNALYMVGCSLIAPFVFLHFLDYRKCYWKVGGASRKRLQENLLRKFVNYDEDSRTNVKHSHLVMAMTRDSNEIVQDCFMQVFKILKSVQKLVLILFWMGLFADPISLPAIILFPFALHAFLKCRTKKTEAAGDATVESQNDLVEYVHEVVSMYPLIADYDRRSIVISTFEDKINHFNKAKTLQAAIMVNNTYFAPWLKTLLVATWFVIGGLLVLGHSPFQDLKIRLGVFLATRQVYNAVAEEYVAIYQMILKVQSVAPAMYRVTKLMNLPVDSEPRMHLNRQRRKLGEECRAHEREEALAAHATGLPADKVEIKFERLKYQYKLVQHKPSSSSKNLSSGLRGVLSGNGKFEQGSFVTVIGPKSEGKSTFLKLVAGVLLPQDGFVFLPPWLRVLHVAAEPLFMSGSLFENLTLGVNPDDPEDADINRIIGICKMLEVPEDVLEMIVSKVNENWASVLSRTQKSLLHFARALVANPDVLVVHHPTLGMDKQLKEDVLSLLKKFVNEKGLLQDVHKSFTRRPRTCIISGFHMGSVLTADHVFLVKDHEVSEVQKEDVVESMFA